MLCTMSEFMQKNTPLAKGIATSALSTSFTNYCEPVISHNEFTSLKEYQLRKNGFMKLFTSTRQLSWIMSSSRVMYQGRCVTITYYREVKT